MRAPLFVIVVLSACSSDSTTQGDHGIPDLDGLANFIVDSARLASSWTLGSDNVEAGSCTSYHNHFHYKHYASALGAPIFCTETWLLHGCQRAIPPRRRYEQLGVACVHDEHHASLMRPR
jgi:hypothetical protein